MKTEHAARGARCSNTYCLAPAVVRVGREHYCIRCLDVLAPFIVGAARTAGTR